MRRSLRALAAATCLVALAACGDDDESTDNTEADTEETTEAGSDDTATDETVTEETAGGEADETLPGGVTLPEGVSEDCLEFAQEWGTTFGGAITGDEEALEELDEAFAEASEIAPEDLQDDFELLAEAMGEFADVLAEHEGDFTDADVQEQLAALSTPELEEASTNISEWFATECAAG